MEIIHRLLWLFFVTAGKMHRAAYDDLNLHVNSKAEHENTIPLGYTITYG